jgi:serine/threonine-protein kinase RsbW
MNAVEQHISLDIPARGEYVVLCRLALTGLLRDRGFSEDAVADLKLAITEACTNSIRHAYSDDHGDVGQVHVSYEVQDDRVVLIVQDKGVGFDDNRTEPARPANDPLPTEGGMGIAIIQAVVDEFRIEQPPQGGTRLVLTKLCDS